MAKVEIVEAGTAASGATPLVLVGLEGPPGGASETTDKAWSVGFAGRAGQFRCIFSDQSEPVALLLGTGRGSPSDIVRAANALVEKVAPQHEHLHLVARVRGASSDQLLAQLVQAICIADWSFDEYRSKAPARCSLRLTIEGPDAAGRIAFEEAVSVADSINFARRLVTEPPNILTPSGFVQQARLLEDLGVEVRTLEREELERLGFGALLAVSRGSAQPPALLVLHWKGARDSSESIALVGKGVCFDSGGLSLKRPDAMVDMKWDMAGAAVVVGTMMALARCRVPVDVVGVCGLVENMPGGNAQRPGDVVTSLSGQTIEVVDTDCEGRMVLADCLTWVGRNMQAGIVVDVATLTGSVVGALGSQFAGLFANDEKLAAELRETGDLVGERLWPLPLDEAYEPLFESPVADLRNAGGPKGGASIAAAFLAKFVKKGIGWAHLDIAGTAWRDTASDMGPAGATGFGVALLFRWIGKRSMRGS